MDVFYALSESERELRDEPVKPKLWTAVDVSLNEEMMAAYHSASKDQKDEWREHAAAHRDPSRKKTESTQANHDIAAVANELASIVSLKVSRGESFKTKLDILG
jgi:hypothetical protein